MVTSLVMKNAKPGGMSTFKNEVLRRENPSNPVSIPKIGAPDEIEEIDTSEITRAKIREAEKMEKLQVSTTHEQSFSRLTLTLPP